MLPHRSPVRLGVGCSEGPSRAGHSGTVLYLILLVALPATQAARAECPASTITVWCSWGGTTTRTTSLQRDSASRNDAGSYCPDYCIQYSESADAAYDLVAGTMNPQATGAYAGIGEASVSTHDVFTLLGPASAPPITFQARAHGLVASGCVYGPDAEGDASIREGASNSASVSAQSWGQNCTGPPYDIGVSIARAAGSTFDLYLSVHATGGNGDFRGGGGDGHASLSISFPDLPAGYSVVSCQGSAAGQVVPTRRTSWGELKTRYR